MTRAASDFTAMIVIDAQAASYGGVQDPICVATVAETLCHDALRPRELTANDPLIVTAVIVPGITHIGFDLTGHAVSQPFLRTPAST